MNWIRRIQQKIEILKERMASSETEENPFKCRRRTDRETEEEEDIIGDGWDWSSLEALPNDSGRVVHVSWLKYYKVKHPKKQIVLHHTVSGPGISGDLSTWENFNAHIATCVILGRNGNINRLFSSMYWGFHLGAGNRKLDQQSIGIELDSWGPLIKGNGMAYNFPNGRVINTEQGAFYNVYGGRVNVPVTYYPEGFRGYNYYESYTYEQLFSVGKLLLLWHKLYGIPLNYNADMWDISQKALSGEPGVWSHTSYRKPADKQDCHPDPNLISLLKYLEKNH